MKLNFKKAGLIVAASGAFLAANAFAAGHEMSVKPYAHIGVELRSESADDGSTKTSALAFKDGGNRLGVKATKGNVTGQIEFAAGGVNGAGYSARQANVMIDLGNGGKLGIGQQNNIRVGNGGMSNSWTGSVTDLNRGVNGVRYAGVSYSQAIGIGSVAVMVGAKANDDNGDVETSEDGNSINQMTARLTLSPMDALSVQVHYDNYDGDTNKNSIAAAVTYSMGAIKVYAGYNMHTETQDESSDKTEAKRTDMAVTASFDAGVAQPFAGMSTVTNDDTKKDGNDGDNETESNMTLGANFMVLGGKSYVQYDNRTNAKGVKDDKNNSISTGIFYSF